MIQIVVNFDGSDERLDPDDLVAALAPLWCGDVRLVEQVVLPETQSHSRPQGGFVYAFKAHAMGHQLRNYKLEGRVSVSEQNTRHVEVAVCEMFRAEHGCNPEYIEAVQIGGGHMFGRATMGL